MKLLLSIDDLDLYKSRDPIPLECYQCKNTFTKEKHYVQRVLAGDNYISCKFCSSECSHKSKVTTIKLSCAACGEPITKRPCDLRKSKTNRCFCDRSCSGKWNNSHRTKGTRRSKLELWLETKLPKLHKDVLFEFNSKDEILSELDIYIPQLKLAFEINGIFHYKPIYGFERLVKTQKTDEQKVYKCNQSQIQLYVIDVTEMKHFNKSEASKYLDIINEKIGAAREGRSLANNCTGCDATITP